MSSQIISTDFSVVSNNFYSPTVKSQALMLINEKYQRVRF